MKTPRGWTLVAAALAIGGCRKPPPPDLAEAAYRHAVELFAKASADTHDLTYRDPRFDGVLAALAEVPAGDELRPKADALGQQILDARRRADALDREGEQKVAEALAEPAFVPLPVDAPMPAPGGARRGGPGATGATGPATLSSGWTPSSSPGAAQRGGDTELPFYYRLAGYLGYHRSAGGAPVQSSAAPAAAPPPPPAEAKAPSPAPSPRAAPSSAPAQQGPPAVYGLPGPAGRALILPQPPP